jgi:cytochrome oxidase Cu insertion factor (SCO1/SenC/PrrC family)
MAYKRSSLPVLLALAVWSATVSARNGLLAAQPKSEAEPKPSVISDEFEGHRGLDWQNRNPDQSHLSLHKRPGTLTITTQQGGFYGSNTSYKNLLLLENPVEDGGDFELTTCLVSFAPFANVQQAGLVCWNDEDNYVKWVFEWSDYIGGQAFSLVRETQARPSSATYGHAMGRGERVWLRLIKRGNRYEYAASRDGKSFRVFGESAWSGEHPRWIGLVAKNSADSGAPEIDASFEFFKIREKPAGEEPVDPDAMPAGGPDELLKFIEDLKKFRPGATWAMVAAARSILAQEKSDSSKAFQTALRVMLEDRIRRIHRSDPESQRQTLDFLKMFLKGMAEHGLEPADMDLAMSAAQAVERAGQEAMAAEAYRSFAEMAAQSKDKELAALVERFEAAARRLDLLGKNLRLEGTAVDGAKLDWEAYRGKVVLVYFGARSSGLCRAELAAIKRYHDIYHDRGLEVVEISVDQDRQALEQFLGEQQSPWVTLHEEDADGTHPVAEHYGVTAVPASFLVDRASTVVSLFARGGQLRQLLIDLLGPPYGHGKALAIAGRWGQLAADFEKVVEISPDNGGCWLSLAVAYLQAQDTEGYKRTCGRAFQQLSDSHMWAQAILVQVCSLAPDAGLDRKELTRVADAARSGSDNNTMKLAKGMDDYRCGRFEEAIENLPTSGDTRQVPALLLFKAMAHKQLGHEDEARRLLQQGILEMEQRIPEIEGPPLPDYMPARWVVWAMHQVVRREAEELIVGQDRKTGSQ